MIRQVRELHIRREVRARYQVDGALFTLSGDAILPNLRAVRALAATMTAVRRAAGDPDPVVAPGSLNAMGLIDEILHAVVAIYREHEDPEAIDDALNHLDEVLGAAAVDDVLVRFTTDYPPLAVHRGELTPEGYLAGETAGTPNREVALEELAACWLENANPAFDPCRELFDDRDLAATTRYRAVIEELARFFAGRAPFGPDRQDLVTMLRAPALAEPGSLAGQLRWIRARWGPFLAAYLGERFGALLDRLVTGLDVATEEERASWMRHHPGPGGHGGAGYAPSYGGLEVEPERFSEDLVWMPRVVLMAKNAYVWLDQLSSRYGREVRRLDQVPDEELDRLARWGFTGLWLIGLWERSRASQRIKQFRGNPDAVASAYSLRDYAIAADLGGEAAWAVLRDQAWTRGIRLASDMVPNHMGIDSRWVVEHPDWFLSRPDSPYPGYTFGGADLSDDPRVRIQIEDHYWDSTDAAVVFRREDRWTGDVRFVYHGNDGTSMPWNDTAQLDYLKPEVREAVIQAILAVARRFPIIRFDAAMTLAKKHVARLWYPEPGQGGAIPSRAESAMTRQAFDAAIPEEFWREVVDRVAAEVPDTLLLAEAFWLMEGYFVRTLGMHRVYNSAFMHMLRDEKNAEYRLLVRNTLEFDPEILKRYVNFMSNPDEKTALEQFGTGDKYFGIATVLATMPGLPMFGHGQVEGFAEKYGMEFRRAYWDERPNEGLVARHEWQLFPLLHRRRLFAEVRDFRFYDVVDDAGHVNEDVLAYSNRSAGERSLVIYHNRFGSMRGRIRDSVAYSARDGSGAKHLVRSSLAEGLSLSSDPGAVVLFRDTIEGLEYIRESGDLRDRGLRVELEAYEARVLLDWREVGGEAAAEYRALAGDLGGAGVPSVEAALAERRLRPLHDAVAIVVNDGLVRDVTDALATHLAAAARAAAAAQHLAPPDLDALVTRWRARALDALRAVRAVAGPAVPDRDLEEQADRFGARLQAALDAALAVPGPADPGGADGAGRAAGPVADAPAIFLAASLPPDTATWGALLGWLAADAIAAVLEPDPGARAARGWFDRARLGRVFADAYRWRGLDEGAAWWTVETVRHLLARPGATALAAPAGERAARLVRAWFADDDLGRWLGVNRHEGIAYLNRESFEAALRWMVVLAAVEGEPGGRGEPGPGAILEDAHALALQLTADAAAVNYEVGRLVERVTA
ncbi:MAG TPA: alpha-amylase family glycosyl hydrolase [Patescibacteria group bacterium]|nr:alpha-amylase family glycosyl hydrolase [Patescibacteria group bacterium]